VTQGRRVAALGLLAASLGGVIVAEFFELPIGAHLPVAVVSRAIKAPPALPVADTADNAQQQWVATLLARPPFSPARRPPAVAAAADAAAPGVPRLAGILVSPSRKLAIFAADGAAKPLTALEGDAVGRYRVLSIEVSEVILRGADGTHVLHLSFGAGLRPSAGPAPVAQRTGLAASGNTVHRPADQD
jgi:hypothetical protein